MPPEDTTQTTQPTQPTLPSANSPEARTETGELKDPAQLAKDQAKTTTSSGTTPKEGEAGGAEGTSLVNKDDKGEKPPEGAPEKYADWKVPDGFEIPEEQGKEVNELFKGLNLSQDAGQKLIDYYAKQSQQAAEAPFKLWQETQEKWQTEVKNDPEIGGKIDTVKTTIRQAIDQVAGPELGKQFREAMDYTGAGNNLAFIKTFWKLAQVLTEGSNVAGGGPSKFGQANPKAGPVSGAKALYPHLP